MVKRITGLTGVIFHHVLIVSVGTTQSSAEVHRGTSGPDGHRVSRCLASPEEQILYVMYERHPRRIGGPIDRR